MLKKLVRYGNSNALVLDKAILELLNIAEGSIVKISTDGHSIILTPHKEAVTLPVNETVTSMEALRLANIKESMKYYKNLNPDVRKNLEKEMLALMDNRDALMISLISNEAYKKDMDLSKIACGIDFAKFSEAHKALMEKYVPELAEYPKAMLEFDKKCRRLAGMEQPDDLTEKQKQMNKAFEELFAKHKDVQMEFGIAMNSSEYQHRAQLLTEKYQGDQSSQEFVQEMRNLIYEFCPAMEKVHQGVADISQKYTNV